MSEQKSGSLGDQTSPKVITPVASGSLPNTLADSLTNDGLCPHGHSRGYCGDPACMPFNAGIGQLGLPKITVCPECMMESISNADGSFHCTNCGWAEEDET